MRGWGVGWVGGGWGVGGDIILCIHIYVSLCESEYAKQWDRVEPPKRFAGNGSTRRKAWRIATVSSGWIGCAGLVKFPYCGNG